MKSTSRRRSNLICFVKCIVSVSLLLFLAGCREKTASSGWVDLFVSDAYTLMIPTTYRDSLVPFSLATRSAFSIFGSIDAVKPLGETGTSQDEFVRSVELTDAGRQMVKIGEKEFKVKYRNLQLDYSGVSGVPRVLGYNFLANKIIRLNTDSMKIKFDAVLDPQIVKGMNRVPIRLRNNVPFVKLKINGTWKDFVLDTESTEHLTIADISDCEFVWTYAPSEEDRKSGSGPTQNTGWGKRNVGIGKYHFSQDVVYFDQNVVDNRLGFPFLLRFKTVVIDLKNNCLYLGKLQEGKDLQLIQHYISFINSIGFGFATEGYPVVNRILSGATHSVQLGDTLFQIGNTRVFQSIPFKSLQDTTFSRVHHALRALQYSNIRKFEILTRRNGKLTKHYIVGPQSKSHQVALKFWTRHLPSNLTDLLIFEDEKSRIKGLKEFQQMKWLIP